MASDKYASAIKDFHAKYASAINDFHGAKQADPVPDVGGPSLTRQEFAEECDINTLMKRYDGHVIGGPGNMRPMEPMYFDFAEAPQDLLGYLMFMEDASKQFMSLPAIVRREFDNSAVEFVAFASDPGNIGKMREWGLAPPAKPQKVEPEAPPASGGNPPPDASTHGST